MKDLTIMYDFGSINKSFLVVFIKTYELTLPVKYIELIAKHNGFQFLENCFDYIDSNGDVGGHIQACSLGGTCDNFNLFPQNSNFNNSQYKSSHGV